MKIKCTRAVIIKGQPYEAGDILTVEQHEGLDLINMGKAQPYDEQSLANRAVGLTKKSAGSLVKRKAKK